MAVLQGFTLTKYLEWTRDHLNMVPLDQLGDHLYKDRRASAVSKARSATVVARPKSEHYRRVVPGYQAYSYFNDFYFRIHILPNRISLGNLASPKEYDVEVWNAWLSYRTLNSITEFDTDGLTLSQLATPPTVYMPLEFRSYSLNVALNGPSNISASYLFDFDTEDPVLYIFGLRVIAWPFRPNYPLAEEFTWLTDILKSYSKEQRISVRPRARRKFVLNSILDKVDFSRSKIISREWNHRTFAVPYWFQALKVQNIAAGSTTINLNTANVEFEIGGLAFIYESDKKSEIVEISSISANSIATALPVSQQFKNAFVMPSKSARCFAGVKFKNTVDSLTEVTIDLTVFDSVALPAPSFQSFLGYPVITLQSQLQESLNSSVIKSVDIFDNGSSVVEVDSKYAYTDSSVEISWLLFGATNYVEARKLFDHLKGRQKAFWLPSWNTDLELVEDIFTSTSTLVVKQSGYSQFFSPSSIAIKLKDGSWWFNRVSSIFANSFGFDELTLQNLAGVNIALNQVDFCCFMTMCRLASDTVSIEHHPSYSKVKVVASEIPYVVSNV